MNLNIVIIFLLGLGVVACDGADRFASNSSSSTHIAENIEDNSEIIATVNGQPITKALFQQEMRFRGAHIQGRFNDKEELNNLLDEVIQFELFAQKARELGYHKDPETALAIKKLLVHKLKRTQLDSSLQKIVVKEDEIESAYKANKDKYSSTDMARAAILFMQYGKDETDNQAIKQKARSVRKQAMRLSKETKGFGDLAKQYSDDIRTKHKGGLMSWTSPNAQFTQWPPEVISAIFDLKDIGDISPIITTRYGLVLLRLVDKRKGETKPLKAVSRQIKNTLLTEKKRHWLSEYYQTLKAKADINIDEKKLRQMQTQWSKHADRDQNASQPPRFPLN